MDASALYLRLYDTLADDADYLQSGSADRLLLPEELIVGALGAALGTFANGFFGSLGQMAAKKVSKIVERFHRSEETGDRDALLEALGLLQPSLPLLAKATEDERDTAVQQIAGVLRVRGFPGPASDELAKEIVATLATASADTRQGAS